MKYGAKSIWNEKNIQDKINRGADGIEIQLVTSSPISEMNKKLPAEQLKMIQAIHMPIISEAEQFSITTRKGFKTLIDLVYMLTTLRTSEAGKGLREDLHIVCHYMPNLDDDNNMKYEDAVLILRMLAAQEKSLVFCIENTTGGSIGRVWDYENVQFVKDIGTTNVKTCLDTCHALMVEANEDGISLGEAFKFNAGVCAHVHMCNATDYGDGYGKKKGHGVPFSSAKDRDLQRIIELYRHYEYDADIVYEVREDDYLNCENYSLIKEQVGDGLINKKQNRKAS